MLASRLQLLGWKRALVRVTFGRRSVGGRFSLPIDYGFVIFLAFTAVHAKDLPGRINQLKNKSIYEKHLNSI
jgi:hypothetical protein